LEYKLNINDRVESMEVKTRDNTFEAVTDGESFKVSFSRISDHEIFLVVNGENLNAHITRADNAKIIMIQGRTFVVQDADIAEKRTKKSMDNGATKVTPPMPAVVTLVCVKEKDKVEKGDTLVMISAMKMETTLTAPYGGVVTRVNVKEGDKVMPGEVLIDIQGEALQGEPDSCLPVTSSSQGKMPCSGPPR